MPAFTTVIGRSRLWCYLCETSSSPMSFTVHELMFLTSLRQAFYSRLLTSSLVRGQFLIRVYIVPVQTGCYICNEGKEERGECISLFKNTQERDWTVWKKMCKYWGACNLTIRHLPWKEAGGQRFSASRDFVLGASGNVWDGLWLSFWSVCGILLASSGQIVEMLLNTLQCTGQSPSPQQMIYRVQNVNSAAVGKSGIRGLKQSPGWSPHFTFKPRVV